MKVNFMSDANTAIAQAHTAAQEAKAKKAPTATPNTTARVRRFQEAERRTKALAAPTLADILRLVPSDDQIALIVSAFGVEAGDADELTGAGSSAIRDQYEIMAPVLVSQYRGEPDYRGLKMHLDRIVDAFVRSAYGAANYYESRRQAAKDAANEYANEHRDTDRMGIDGGPNRVDGLRRIAAEHGAKAYVLSNVAAGACAAYRELMGEDWKPYQSGRTQSVSEGAAAAQAAALGF